MICCVPLVAWRLLSPNGRPTVTASCIALCYIHPTKHLRMIGWVGDSLSALQPHLFADADFAGCTATQRSTSGYHFVIRGPNTCFPIMGVSKRQSCVSHSTPEAEMVAADFFLRHCGLPSFALRWTLLPQKPRLRFHEDNQAMIGSQKLVAIPPCAT